MDFNSDILIILLGHLLFSKLNCLLFNCISFLHLVVNFCHLLSSFSSTVLQVHFNNQCHRHVIGYDPVKKRELGGWRACLLCKSTWAFGTEGDEWKLMWIFFLALRNYGKDIHSTNGGRADTREERVILLMRVLYQAL